MKGICNGNMIGMCQDGGFRVGISSHPRTQKYDHSLTKIFSIVQYIIPQYLSIYIKQIPL
jgi:hypothetical protein